MVINKSDRDDFALWIMEQFESGKEIAFSFQSEACSHFRYERKVQKYVYRDEIAIQQTA